MRNITSKKLCWMMVFVLFLTWSGLLRRPALAQQAGALSAEDRKKAAERLEQQGRATVQQRSLEVLGRLLKIAKQEVLKPGADPADVDAKAAELGYEPHRMFYFVRDQVATEPYRGILRGERGTLACRAGNSFDRALLLKALLASAGHESRIVSGSLSADQTERLLSTFLHQSSADEVRAREESTPQALEQAVAEIASKAGLPHESVEAILARNASRAQVIHRQAREQEERQYAFLKKYLERAGFKETVDATAQRAELIERLRTHYWVQIRDPASGKWVDLDSAFPEAKPGQRYTIEEERPAKLADKDWHRLEFSLIYRYKSKDEAKDEPILRQSIPVATTLFEPLGFSILPAEESLPSPSEFMDMDQKQRMEVLRKIKKFQPILRWGGQRYGGRPFDLEGNLYDVSSSGRIKAVEDLGDVLRGLSLFGRRQKEPERTFLSLDVELRLERPGAPPIVRTRSLVRGEDLTKPDFFPPLLEWEIFVQTQVVPETLATYQTLKDLIPRVRNLLEALQALGLQASDMKKLDQLLTREASPFPRNLLPFVLGRQEAQARILSRLPKVSALIDSPNVFIAGRRLGVDGQTGQLRTFWMIDIVENAVSFVPKDERSAAAAFDVSMRQGIAESVLEALLLCPVNCVQSTSTLFERARLEGRSTTVVSPREVHKLRSLGLKDSDIEWIQKSEAESSCLVVAQTRDGAAVWWSITNDGVCIGRISGGHGGTFGDYILLFLKIVGWTVCLGEIGELGHHLSLMGALGLGVCMTLGGISAKHAWMHYVLGKHIGLWAWVVVVEELAGATVFTFAH